MKKLNKKVSIFCLSSALILSSGAVAFGQSNSEVDIITTSTASDEPGFAHEDPGTGGTSSASSSSGGPSDLTAAAVAGAVGGFFGEFGKAIFGMSGSIEEADYKEALGR